MAAPALITLILIYCYIEETPEFLIQSNAKDALAALNRIGKINLDRKSTLEEEDIQNVVDYQMTE